MLKRLMILGMVIIPWGVQAGETRDWEQASLDAIWADGRQESALNLTEFQDNILHDGEIFLHTKIGPQQCFVIAVTKDTSHLLELPGEGEMINLLSRFHRLASLEESDQQELAAVALQVSEILLGPLKADLESCKSIIFAPDGIFNLVPTSLLLPQHRNISFSRVPSASILMDFRQSVTTLKPIIKPRTLAVGGVIEADSATAFQDMQDLDDTFAGVTVVRPNHGAAAPQLDRLAGFDIIHVAARCIGDNHNPSQSAIALDPSNPEMMIRAADLTNLQLDTGLVVLARCLSATGRNLSGAGIQELTSAFLTAGVSAVVAQLWPVDDETTRFFMASFYEGLSQGNDAAGSLASARTKCRQDPRFNLPFHWGGFVLVGDGQLEVPLEIKTVLGGFRMWMILLAGVSVGLFLLF